MSWHCRMCGHEQYKTVFETMLGVGPVSHKPKAKYHECSGCSVHFSDPEKFGLGDYPGSAPPIHHPDGGRTGD